MKKISELLEGYFRKQFHFCILKQGSKRNPYLLMNCPLAMCEDLYNRLTANGEEVFQVSGNGRSEEIAVLLVNNNSDSQGRKAYSQISNWDYACNIRDSIPHSLLLCPPESINKSQESILDTSLVIGPPARWVTREFFDGFPWNEIIKVIHEKLGVSQEIICFVLGELSEEGPEITGIERMNAPWISADEILEEVRPDRFLQVSGHLSIGAEPLNIDNVKKSREVLKKLAESISKNGFETTKEFLKKAIKPYWNLAHLGKIKKRPLMMFLTTLIQLMRFHLVVHPLGISGRILKVIHGGLVLPLKSSKDYLNPVGVLFPQLPNAWY